jgi:hypothetical protein
MALECIICVTYQSVDLLLTKLCISIQVVVSVKRTARIDIWMKS